MEELGYPQKIISIEQDNKSAIQIMNRRPGKMGKSKSISIKYYWIIQTINDGIITLKYGPSKQILADGFTKPLNGIDFIEWRKQF